MRNRRLVRVGVVLAALVVLGLIANFVLEINVPFVISAAVANSLGWILLVVVAFFLGRWTARPTRSPGRFGERDRVRRGRP